MSDEPEQEGWDVPARAPLLAMAATSLVLGVALFAGGRVYLHTLAPAIRVAPPLLPAPRLETGGAAPGEHRPDHREPAPLDLPRAMAATAARGDALWEAARP